MDIRTLLREEDPDDKLPVAPNNLEQPTTKATRPSLPAYSNLGIPSTSGSPFTNTRSRLRPRQQTSQKGQLSPLLNSSPRLSPRTMDDVLQEGYADEDPEVLAAAQILVKISNVCNGEGTNLRRESGSSSQELEDLSGQSTISSACSPKSPVHGSSCSGNVGSLDRNSFTNHQPRPQDVPFVIIHGNSSNPPQPGLASTSTSTSVQPSSIQPNRFDRFIQYQKM